MGSICSATNEQFDPVIQQFDPNHSGLRKVKRQFKKIRQPEEPNMNDMDVKRITMILDEDRPAEADDKDGDLIVEEEKQTQIKQVALKKILFDYSLYDKWVEDEEDESKFILKHKDDPGQDQTIEFDIDDDGDEDQHSAEWTGFRTSFMNELI